MASFHVDLSADPSWLHVARITAVLGAATVDRAGVDFLDDVMLAVGEAILEVCVTPGVTHIDLTVDPRSDRVMVSVKGRGDAIEYEESAETVIDAVLVGLTTGTVVRRRPQEYSIDFTVVAA